MPLFFTLLLHRYRAAEARHAHNVEVVGANPTGGTCVKFFALKEHTFFLMAEVDENGNSSNTENEPIVTESGTSPDEGNGNGQPEAVDLAKLKVEDLDTMDEAKRLEVSKLLLAKNHDLFARVNKKPLTAAPQSKSGDIEPSITDAVKQLQLSERKRTFAYENNLSPEETDAVFRINPKPSKEVLNDPFIKGGIEAIRAKRRVENATPNSSGRTATFNGKQFHEMSKEEKVKNYADVVKAAIEARRK